MTTGWRRWWRSFTGADHLMPDGRLLSEVAENMLEIQRDIHALTRRIQGRLKEGGHG